MEPLDPHADLPPLDRAILRMVEDLGYSAPNAATLLKIDAAQVRAIVRRHRSKTNPAKQLRETLLAKAQVWRRDFLALEMVEVMEFSIGDAAKLLKINKGHLCRRLERTRNLIREAGDPRQ
ncbi:MAG: hypothetical protein JSS49_22535 [Planctomycetes bacterium]|nr:hypothetical protein [Planctomycetota bacterium]